MRWRSSCGPHPMPPCCSSASSERLGRRVRSVRITGSRGDSRSRPPRVDRVYAIERSTCNSATIADRRKPDRDRAAFKRCAICERSWVSDPNNGVRPQADFQNLNSSTFFGVTIWAGAENDFALGPDGIVAKPTGREFVAFLAGDLALGQRLRAIIGEVAKVLHVPPDVLNGPILDIFLDQRRRGKSGELDFAERACLFERARCGWEADAGRDDDALEIRERLDQRERLLLVDLLALLRRRRSGRGSSLRISDPPASPS